MSTTDLLLEAPDAAEVPTAGIEIAARSPMQLFWRRFRQDKVALTSLGFIVVLVLVAFVIGPLLAKASGLPGPNVQNSGALDQFGTPTGPSSAHPLPMYCRVTYGRCA